ncbi:MAG: DUF2034 domain-containing protein [Sulfuricellaceae bacterium]
MDRFQEKQTQIFVSLLNDPRLTLSAQRQIQIFLDILNQEPGIGFDTTSALLYGFLKNNEFTRQDICPLFSRQLKEAENISRYEATRNTAHEDILLKRVSRLPLAKLLGPKLDLADLAISFLTYASDEPYFAYSYERNKKLYEYLDIPQHYYLNVYNLRNDLSSIGMSIDDFIINLSRLRTSLYIPEYRFITIEYRRLVETILPNLPEALFCLNGEELEHLMMELFDRAGYGVAKIGRCTYEKDGGVDIIAYRKDSFAGELRLAVQCKATKNRIETRVIREFNTSLQDFKSHKGVFVTTSDFTSDANVAVKKCAYPIELMDYVKLTNRIRGTVIKN